LLWELIGYLALLGAFLGITGLMRLLWKRVKK